MLRHENHTRGLGLIGVIRLVGKKCGLLVGYCRVQLLTDGLAWPSIDSLHGLLTGHMA